MLNVGLHKFKSLDGRHFSNDGCAARSDHDAMKITAVELRARVMSSMSLRHLVPDRMLTRELDALVAAELRGVPVC